MDETRPTPYSGPGHETADVNIWAIGRFAVALIILCLVSIGLLFGLIRFFQSQQTTSIAKPVDPVKLFPEPQLQRNPRLDLRAVREEENKLLDGYAWVDPQKGLVRIPIDQAIEVLAKRGLPARTQTPMLSAPPDVSVPTESSLGFKLQREGGPLTPGGTRTPEGIVPPPAAEQRSVVGPDRSRPEQVNSKEGIRK